MGEYSFQGIYPDLDWGKNKTWLLKMLEQQKQPERETKKEKTQSQQSVIKKKTFLWFVMHYFLNRFH